MARSFSNVTALPALLVNNLSLASSRRSYAAAASPAMSVSSRSSIARTTGNSSGAAKEQIGQEGETCAWIPDPVTGYYRPANQPQEINVAELREALFKQKTIESH